ncbi:retrovirus-related pol polyprotein from transposon TNT 1-94 [Tanacetum coccineum]
MDLCGPMRVASVNGKKYILIIVDDYSRFTWVKFLRSKDEAPDFIIKFLKMIQLRLKVPVRRIRTDNGTEFVNQTLREYYEKEASSIPAVHRITFLNYINQQLQLTKMHHQPRTHQTTPIPQPPVIPNDVEEDNHDIEVAHMGNDPYFGIPIPKVPSDQSSLSDSIHDKCCLSPSPDHQISKHNNKWTKDHPLENIICELARPVSTRLQLHEQALFCY